MAEQTSLKIVVEKFTAREKKLIKHLKAFRTIDADIRALLRVVQGHDLPEPSVTAGPPREDDPEVMWELEHGSLSDVQQEMATTIERYIEVQAFTSKTDLEASRTNSRSRNRLITSYASSHRVAKAVGSVRTDDPYDSETLQLAYNLLHRVVDDTKLNETERCAEIRIQRRDKAKVDMYRLLNQKQIIAGALQDMKKYYLEWWTILWYRYVQAEHWKNVCELASRNGVPLTDDEYRLSRKKALQQFNKWTVGL